MAKQLSTNRSYAQGDKTIYSDQKWLHGLLAIMQRHHLSDSTSENGDKELHKRSEKRISVYKNQNPSCESQTKKRKNLCQKPKTLMRFEFKTKQMGTYESVASGWLDPEAAIVEAVQSKVREETCKPSFYRLLADALLLAKTMRFHKKKTIKSNYV